MTTPNYAAALQDPEYLALLAQLNASLQNQMAENDSQQVNVKTQIGQQLRDASIALPQDLKNSEESAAGRGMLHAGGLLEQQGGIQKQFADYSSQLNTDQNTQLAGLLRNRNAAQTDFNAQKESGLQSAASRALTRAQSQPLIAPATSTALATGTPTAAGPPQSTGGMDPNVLSILNSGKLTSPAKPAVAAKPVAAKDPTRAMSSFDKASQAKLSYGQTVTAGDGRKMRYDPLTGRVVVA